MAGPWFAVHECENSSAGVSDTEGSEGTVGPIGNWQRLDQVWISNGETDCQGQIEIKISLENPNES